MRFGFIPSVVAVLLVTVTSMRAETPPLVLKQADYEDRVHAAWLGQIMGVLLTLPFEHQVSAVRPVKQFPKPYTSAIVDDDWYYEMCAVRGFERFGPKMTVTELGEMWQAHNCGTWGSSRYAREAMARGVKPEEAGHPRYNRLWFTIGPTFSCELYGMLAPGDPNLAGKLARDLGRINGYAEGLDGGVFAAGLVSIAFREQDPREVVRQAANLIHPDSPFRQSVDLVIRLAEQGKTAREVFDAVEDRWHIEYPATNNAVANGGLLATCVWFGEGDFATTIDLAAGAGDFSDTDNFAAVACAVVGAMHGTKALPANLVRQLNDRIAGADMGGVRKLTPPVDEKISDLARRTAAVGVKLMADHGSSVEDGTLNVPYQTVETLPSQRFRLGDLTPCWNEGWTLERAGFGGGDGGMGGIRGMTYLDGDVLATYPRDEIRGLVIRQTVKAGENSELTFQAGVDPGRAWNLDVYLDNDKAFGKRIEAPKEAQERYWEEVRVDLSAFAGEEVHVRLFQRVLIDGKTAGNAYWRELRVR